MPIAARCLRMEESSKIVTGFVSAWSQKSTRCSGHLWNWR